MSEMFFYELIAACQAQIGPKVKNALNLLKFGASNILSVPISILMPKILFYEIFTICQAQIGPKTKNVQNLLKFGTSNFSFKCANLHFNIKNIFYEILTTCQVQIGFKIKNAQNFSKFGQFGISNMPISILMSNLIFIKYLPLVTPKLVPKLKVLRIYSNLE